MNEEETEKKLQNLIHKSEIMMSTTVEHIGTGIICKMSDEDKKTLVDLIAMCLDFRSLYIKEKEKKGYTATEIQITERQAYNRGRADEELRWKDVKDDLTTVYLSGFHDGEKKWKDKIKEKINKKIKECEKRRFSDFTSEPNFAVEKVLKELSEEVE